MIVGNDISKYQGNVDWDTYKKNSNFVIVKASEGDGYIDPNFKKFQSEARRVGLPLGYYHFARPDLNNSPEAEADWFLKCVGEPKDGETYYLDYEANYSGDVVGWCKKFLDRCASKLNGTKPLVYVNQNVVTKYNWQPVVDGGYGLWIAAYTFDPNNNDFQHGKWPFAAMQQWTNKQTVPGIAGAVDGDVFFGDVETLKKYGYKGGSTPTPTPPPPSSPDIQVKFKKFFEDNNNKSVEVSDPSALDQCMDLAAAWCQALGIPYEAIRHPYAHQVWDDASDLTRKYFDLIPNVVNDPTVVPKTGDLVVFKKISGIPVGHISIETGESGSVDLISFDQNWDTANYYHLDPDGKHIPYCRKVTHKNYYGVSGWLRPKISVVPTPTPPSPTPPEPTPPAPQPPTPPQPVPTPPEPTPTPTPPPDNNQVILDELRATLYSKWTWIGKNGWKIRLAQLKQILPQK